MSMATTSEAMAATTKTATSDFHQRRKKRTVD